MSPQSQGYVLEWGSEFRMYGASTLLQKDQIKRFRAGGAIMISLHSGDFEGGCNALVDCEPHQG